MVKGDRVNIVKRVDRNWWEAEKAGDVGIVPVTYVKVVFFANKKMYVSKPLKFIK